MSEKLYTLRIRQQDGTWTRDPMPTSLRVARRNARFNRVLAGITNQVVPANEEEIKNWKDENEI